MSEDEKEQTASAEEAEPKVAKKSALSGYLLYGGIGLVVIAATIFGTLMILGSPTPASSDEATVADSIVGDSTAIEGVAHGESDVAKVDDHHAEMPEFVPEEFDTHSVLKDIQANLEFLDYRPEEDVDKKDPGISKEDSIDAANWLKVEKSKLARREKEVADRETKLEILDKKVSQKILRIEQAESAKIQSLAKLYDNMDPRSVAQLAANLDDATIVSILPRMKQKNASQVLALMPAQRAARLSKQMITIAGN